MRLRSTAKDTMWYVIGVALSELLFPTATGALFGKVGYIVLPFALLGLAAAQLALLLLVYCFEIRPRMRVLSEETIRKSIENVNPVEEARTSMTL